MKRDSNLSRNRVLTLCLLVAGLAVGFIGGRSLTAQEDPLGTGTILQRTELSGAEGIEAILVLRPLPAGAESGPHTQSGNEIVYVLEGAVVLEVEGEDPANVAAGEAFTTSAGEVHNVKNASDSEPARALAFYVAKTGATLEDLAVPTQ